MAVPTNTYADFAAGNDYKGASFTDGAYTSATKTLVKGSAFAASQVNHWLYLTSNDGGSIVAGYYKIATVTDANTVILATDAGAGTDDDAAKCTQAAGTALLPWRSIQGALDLITKDATNGDQVNVKAGTAQVNQAALTLARYGTPAEGVPLVFRGYTAAANDGGIGEIDAGGFTLFVDTTNTDMGMIDLEVHTFGDNNGVYVAGARTFLQNCEVHKGASTPSGKVLVGTITSVVGCYIHDAGTSGIGIFVYYNIIGNYIYNCPRGIIMANTYTVCANNIVVDCATAGIQCTNDDITVINNSVYHSSAATGKGIEVTTGSSGAIVYNNVVEGYSGAGGKGLSIISDASIVGYNCFYNNTTNESLGDVLVDLGGDQTPASSPFVNAAAGNFALNTAVAGAIETAYPNGTWPGLATTTNNADMGAVQNGAPAADFPSEDDVRDGVDYDNSAKTGNMTLPSEDDVRLDETFGTDGTEFTGNLELPAVADVRDGTTYGTDGTELEGELVVGGGGDISMPRVRVGH